MANWIKVKLRNGSEYVIRSEVTSAMENPLTNNERIIADLWQQINDLTIPIIGVLVCNTESHAMMKAGVFIKCPDCDEEFKETEH